MALWVLEGDRSSIHAASPACQLRPTPCAVAASVCAEGLMSVWLLQVAQERLSIPACKGMMTHGPHRPRSHLLPQVGVFSLPRTDASWFPPLLPCISQVLDACASPVWSQQDGCQSASPRAEVISLRAGAGCCVKQQ